MTFFFFIPESKPALFNNNFILNVINAQFGGITQSHEIDYIQIKSSVWSLIFINYQKKIIIEKEMQ